MEPEMTRWPFAAEIRANFPGKIGIPIFFQFFFHFQKVQTSLPQEMSPMCVVRLATWSGHPSSVGLLLAILFFSAVSQKSDDAWHFAAC